MSEYQVLIDSDAFVGWMVRKDAHHERASALFEQVMAKRLRCATTSYTVAETATVVSMLAGQDPARHFLTTLVEKRRFPVIFIDEKRYTQVLELFKQQTRRGTSVVDCVNVAVMKELEIPTIFSFDRVYPKDFGLATVERIL